MKTYTRPALIAAFLGGIILGHITTPLSAFADPNASATQSLQKIAAELSEISDTLKKAK